MIATILYTIGILAAALVSVVFLVLAYFVLRVLLLFLAFGLIIAAYRVTGRKGMPTLTFTRKRKV